MGQWSAILFEPGAVFRSLRSERTPDSEPRSGDVRKRHPGAYLLRHYSARCPEDAQIHEGYSTARSKHADCRDIRL